MEMIFKMIKPAKTAFIIVLLLFLILLSPIQLISSPTNLTKQITKKKSSSQLHFLFEKDTQKTKIEFNTSAVIGTGALITIFLHFRSKKRGKEKEN